MTKRLFFAVILLAGCNHSAEETRPASSTAVIPSATASTPKTTDETPVAATPTDGACGVPNDWPVDQAVGKGDDIEILAWRQRVDDRPLFVDDSLVWKKATDGGKPVWSLAHVYRHPKDENQFRLSVVYDAPVSPRENYDHPPTSSEVEAFLKGSSWSWDPEGFQMVAGKICTATWTRVVGEAPKHVFTR